MTGYIDNPDYNDNRNYDYTKHPALERLEYRYILDFVIPDSKIIDLGCGNGSLLEKLIREKNAVAAGVELSKSGVKICQGKGLNVIEGKIDQPMPFENNTFDYSICNVTIQMVMFPETLLKEMKRISKYQIISFPNFGFYLNRFYLLFAGRMPAPMLYEYKWYNTGHIHQLSIKDFNQLLNDIGGLKIIEHKYIKTRNAVKNFLIERFPNLFQQIPIFLLTKTND